ncbi:MAG: bifunctional precorrin-2 dehydrogenase/sirohydrochlorin ferrochelatase [Acidiferrobacterales bacterium]|nr:NAD(P)-dependent oxidoreductase [Pseudomonadota bacterium]
MNFLPIFLRVRARPCLVVGGGEVAARKVSLLRQTGTNVSVVSPTLCKSRASERPRITSVIVTQEILDLTRRDAERIRRETTRLSRRSQRRDKSVNGTPGQDRQTRIAA